MSDPIGKVLVDMLNATLTDLRFSEFARQQVVSEFWLRWKAHEDRAAQAPSEGARDAEIALRVCVDVAELPDRNSPEDWPEAMLVTHEELRTIVLAAIAAEAGAPAPDHGPEALTAQGLLSALAADTLTGAQRAALAAMIRGRA